MSNIPEHTPSLDVQVTAPAGVIAWSSGYGWITEEWELDCAAADKEVVFAVERCPCGRPSCGILRVDRGIEQFKQRVIGDLAMLRAVQDIDVVEQ
jgi:hypothetical protein